MMRAALLVLAACGRFGFGSHDDGAVSGDVVPIVKEDAGVDPVCASSPMTASSVAIGRAHVCAIAAGNLFCWGANDFGQLGTGDTMPRLVPTLIGAPTWTAVTARGNHTCATKGTDLYCWGANDFGQLGLGDGVPRSAPTLVGSGWSTVAAGGEHTCGRQSVDMLCWGHNNRGQLGLGDQSSRNLPTPLAVLMWGSVVAAGGAHTCAVARMGVPAGIYCWGANDRGQISGGDTVDQLVPRAAGCCDQIPVLGATHSLAQHAGPNVQVWGNNANGQLGLGDTMDRNGPITMPDLYGSLAPADAHSCGIRTSTGLVFCWGANDRGQLGLGAPSADHLTAQQVGSDADWAAVWAGGRMTCARKQDGRFYCWGQNDEGQLGLGHTVQRSRPIQVCL